MPYKKGQKWVAQVRLSGKRKEKIFQTKKEAIAWEIRVKKNPDEMLPEETNMVSLIEWANSYLDFAGTKFSKATFDEKKSVFRRFFREVDPGVGIEALTAAQVQKYIMKQKTERSGYAANKDRKNLVAAWNWGKKYMNPQLPALNPCSVEKMPEVRHPRYVPPEEDFWKVLNLTDGQDRVMLLSFLYLAARRGEIFRLKWDDVDFEHDQIRLWTCKRTDGDYEWNWLPMTKDLKQGLKKWHEERPFKTSPYVFLCQEEQKFCQESYGKPFKHRQRFMKSLCERAGVKYFGFHAIRHLTASLLYRMGFPLATIQAILRHKSPSTTEGYIRTLDCDQMRGALEELARRDESVILGANGYGRQKNHYPNKKAVSEAVNF